MSPLCGFGGWGLLPLFYHTVAAMRLTLFGIDTSAKYSVWRTYKLSDHLPMWIELQTDFGEACLWPIALAIAVIQVAYTITN